MNVISIKTAQKDFVRKTTDSIYTVILLSFFQIIFLFLMPPYYRLVFKPGMFAYALGFSVFYMIGYVLLLNAQIEGPASLTNVISSFQIMVPITAGILIWKESITVYHIMGLALFIISVFLFNLNIGGKGPDSGRVTYRWIVSSTGSALSIGAAVIFTKQFMLAYNGSSKQYLIAFNIFVILFGLVYLTAACLKGKFRLKFEPKPFIFIAAAALLQDITNLIYMHYITRFKSATFFPLMGILNILSVVILSRIVLKEKISKPSYAGILLSLAAIYLLGIR